MPDSPPVLLEVTGGIAWLTLNRPERLNAFTAELHQAVRDALDEVEASHDVHALILSGAGRAFCAGQDLRERAEQLGRGEVDLRASLEENYNPLIRRLGRLSHPVIAAVNGVASGAGAGLALACDLVIAARSARFQFPFVKVGLGPDSGASWTVQRLAGPARAMGLLLTGEAIDAATAQAWGMVWEVVDDAALREVAGRYAERIASGPQAAIASLKRQVRSAASLSLDQALDAEREAQAEHGRHADYREAVAAFAEKRQPRFTQTRSLA